MGAACVRLGERPTTKPGATIAVCKVGAAAENTCVSVSECVAESGSKSKSAMSSQTRPGVKPSGASQMRAAPEVWMRNFGDVGEVERPVRMEAMPFP